MNELLFALISLFVVAEAPEHPWLAEAWAEVDEVGTLADCAKRGVTAGDRPHDGFVKITYWRRGDVVERIDFTVCLRDPTRGFVGVNQNGTINWGADWLDGELWFAVAHELAHVYDAAILADRERRVWDHRLEGCHEPDEVMADVFAYTVVDDGTAYRVGPYYERELRAGNCVRPLHEVPSESMDSFVGKAARERAGEGSYPDPILYFWVWAALNHTWVY